MDQTKTSDRRSDHSHPGENPIFASSQIPLNSPVAILPKWLWRHPEFKEIMASEPRQISEVLAAKDTYKDQEIVISGYYVAHLEGPWLAQNTSNLHYPSIAFGSFLGGGASLQNCFDADGGPHAWVEHLTPVLASGIFRVGAPGLESDPFVQKHPQLFDALKDETYLELRSLVAIE